MPMFFFLSGVSAYFALFRRTRKQFREERAHRLFVPWLLLCLLRGVYSVTWLAPLTPNCEAAYRGDEINSTTAGVQWSHCEHYVVLTENTTFIQYLQDQYTWPMFPSAGQGWFLLYLFVYSQVLTNLLFLWHPSHGPEENSNCSPPYSRVTKLLGCMCFFFRPASSPQEL